MRHFLHLAAVTQGSLLHPNANYPSQSTNSSGYAPNQQVAYSQPADQLLYPPSVPMQQQLNNSPYPASHNNLYPEQPPAYSEN